MTINERFNGTVTFSHSYWEKDETKLEQLKTIPELNVQYTPDGIQLVRAQVKWNDTVPEAICNASCFTVGFPQQFVASKKVGEVFSLTISARNLNNEPMTYEVKITCSENSAVLNVPRFISGRGSNSASRMQNLPPDLETIFESN